jgi:hypothetical protein
MGTIWMAAPPFLLLTDEIGIPAPLVYQNALLAYLPALRVHPGDAAIQRAPSGARRR